MAYPSIVSITDNGKTVKDWLEMKPATPDWKTLRKLQEVAYQERDL
jgi:hypothetical protein